MYLVLLSFGGKLAGHRVKLLTNNQGVMYINLFVLAQKRSICRKVVDNFTVNWGRETNRWEPPLYLPLAMLQRGTTLVVLMCGSLHHSGLFSVQMASI